MMSKKISALALVGVLTLAPMFVSAQVTPPPGGQRQRLELERRLQLGFQRSIQNQLGLGQETMQSVRIVMQSFQEDRSALNRAQASLRYRLRDPALPDMGEDEAKALVQEMVDLQQRELDLYKKEQGELLRVLSPVQLIRFYRLREAMGQRVQQLRQGRGQGGGRGGAGGLAPPPGGGGGRTFR
jgi:Spy/CpxP family protein refolding chaperone